jgi:ribonuclease P/MRP protein subunit RPP40
VKKIASLNTGMKLRGGLTKEPTCAVYFDFQKAFDKVPHQQLLQKLSSSGITGRTHQWIKSWLSGRKQRVVLNGQYSSEISVTSSVPQGSVLGPTLFLVFINDLTEKIQLLNYLYADDTKIIGSTATIADKQRLQDDIDNFLQWSLKWQMPVNVTKCNILPFGKSGGLPGSDLEMTKCKKT